MQNLPNAAAWAEHSLFRAISDAANDRLNGSRSLEAEMNRDLAARYGLPDVPGKIYLPEAVLRRDMSVAGVSGSQYLVSTGAQAPVDLPNTSIVIKAGAQRLTDLRGNVVIPLTVTDPTAYWLGDEHTAITESHPALGQVSLEPKTVGCVVTISRDLYKSGPAVDRYLRAVLMRAYDEMLDAAAIAGTGIAGQPMGIVNTTGVGTGTVDATTPHDDICDLVQQVAEAGSEPSAVIAPPAVRRLLQGRARLSGTGAVWDGSDVAGVKAYAANNCPASTMIVGDWSQLLIASWGPVEIAVDPATFFASGRISLRMMAHVDTALIRRSAFAVASVA